MKMSTRDGRTKTRLFRIWKMMKARCLYPSQDRYDRYGGRGIKVCKEWLDFDVFRTWALDNGYEDGLSIDRINNDGDYEADNCRWVTMKEQAQNRSNSRMLTIGSKTATLSEWSEISGTKQSTISMRLSRYGYTDQEAVFGKTDG